jgi:hypothetical protein
MVATSTKWENTSTLPYGATYEQRLEFFGIPPATAEQLDANITRKRRTWRRKSEGGNEEGRNKAIRVLNLIDSVSQQLKRGVADEAGGGATAEIPDAVFETLDELWRIISEYVFADEYDEALRVAREAMNRWQKSPDAASVLAWVVATGWNNEALGHPAVLAEGLDAAEIAVRADPADGRNWESAASLLMANSRVSDAVAAIDRAEQATGGRISAALCLLRARTAVTMGKADDAMTAAVRAVHRADPARAAAIRSEATEMLVDWLAGMLPIKSADTLNRYVEMVNVAAWCSFGVPEAEDQVRVHRMWAANAGKRVFAGSDRMRSFLAVCTGFISLPIHNYLRSEPMWRVLAEGLDKTEHNEAFILVALPDYVQRLHHFNLAVLLNQPSG